MKCGPEGRDAREALGVRRRLDEPGSEAEEPPV